MGTNIPDSLLSSPPVSCSGLLFVELNRKPEGRGTQVTKPQSTAYSSKKRTIIYGREDSGASSAQEV